MASKLWFLAPIFTAAIALAAYLPTVAPSISWLNGGSDSGELAAAVAVLGIPHPPGYPTYVLLGRLWAGLPLGGDLAYRLNLLSAASLAATAALITALVLLLARPTAPRPVTLLGAVLGGLIVALAPLTWSQATITEVYGPGLLLLALTSLAVLHWRQQPHLRSLALVGLAGGLALGITPQVVLLLPGALLVLYKGRGRLRFCLPALLLGLSTFAYLPLRAAAQPFINWGDPVSPARFWAVVSMAQYQPYLALLGTGSWLERLLASLMQLGQQLSWAGFSLALLGGYSLWRQDRLSAGYLFLLITASVLFRTSYPVLNNLVYLLPALFGLGALAGLGIVQLLVLARGQAGNPLALLIGLGLVVVLSLRATAIVPLVDASDDYRAIQFGQQTLAGLPSNALVLTDRDESTFSLWYQQALGRKPQVAVIDTRLLGEDWYIRQLNRRYPDLDPVLLAAGHWKELGRPVVVPSLESP